MVTDDQLNRIKQLRANGRSHQEIADEVDLSRSAVAYQLNKLKDTPVPSSTIQVVVAQDFEPQTTTVSFDPRIFEQHRQNDTLYATGQDLYEMRGEIIHKTTLPNGVPARVYPEIVDLIRADANWFSLPHRHQLIQEFDQQARQGWMNTWGNSDWVTRLTHRQDHHPHTNQMVHPHTNQMVPMFPFNYRQVQGQLRNYWEPIVAKKRELLLQDMPAPNEPAELLRYVANLPKSPEEIVAEAQSELDELLQGVRVNETNENNQIILELISHPPLVNDYFASKKIKGKDNISFCIQNEIDSPAKMKIFKDSGAGSQAQFEKLKVVKFPDWASYERAQKWAIALHPAPGNPDRCTLPPPHFNVQQKKIWLGPSQQNHIQQNMQIGDPSYIRFKEMQKLEEIGWTPKTFGAAKKLGFTKNQFDQYTQAQEKFKALNLPLNEENVRWAKSVKWELDSYVGFPSPRAAVIHGIIEMSPTTHLRLDSLLTQYQSNSAPGPDIHDVEQLHKLLCKKPFNKMCVSNLEGGIIEKIIAAME